MREERRLGDGAPIEERFSDGDERGENAVGGVAGGVGEAIEAHAALGFEMADARLAFDRRGDAPLLAGDADLEPALGRSVVTVATMLRITLGEPRSPTIRSRSAPICACISGATTPSVWPS